LTTYTAAGRLKAITAGSIGNLVEWYDWYAYSAAALYFAPIFFPAGDQTAQLLQTAAVFAVAFSAAVVRGGGGGAQSHFGANYTCAEISSPFCSGAPK